jgi:hypothetical protein
MPPRLSALLDLEDVLLVERAAVLAEEILEAHELLLDLGPELAELVGLFLCSGRGRLSDLLPETLDLLLAEARREPRS